MQTRTQPELVNSWRSATDRPNILVVAPPGAEYIESIGTLNKGDPHCEVVNIESAPDAVRLLRRGNIAVVVLDAAPQQAGCLELILEGLAKQHPPRFVILSSSVGGRPKALTALIRIVGAQLERPVLRQVILTACKDFEAGGQQVSVTARELLQAVVSFPDEAWLRICGEAGEYGDLCFKNGRIIYSELGRLSGEMAAARILSWKACLFEYRALPDFLAPNMDRPIEHLDRINRDPAPPTQPGVPPAPAPGGKASEPAAAAAPKPEYPMETEEPTDFPSLMQFAANVQDESPGGRAADIEEPMGFPEFGSLASEGPDGGQEEPEEPRFEARFAESGQIEEPLDMMLEESEQPAPVLLPAPIDSDEPELPDFSQTAREPASKTAEINAEIMLSRSVGSLFTAVAVIAEGKAELEICTPEAEKDCFHPAALRELFDRAGQYAHRYRLGSPQSVSVCGSSSSIALALIPDSNRLLAVRFNSTRFGEAEEAELKKLLGSLLINAPVSSA